MFRTVFPSIIRSYDCTYGIRYRSYRSADCLLAVSRPVLLHLVGYTIETCDFCHHNAVSVPNLYGVTRSGDTEQ